MRILVVGAHHGVGALVVEQLRAAGHDVLPFEGDVCDRAAVHEAVRRAEAVISVLGPRQGSPDGLCALGTRHLVDAMGAAGVRRLVQVTGAMVGHPRDRLGLLYRFIQSRVPHAALADRRAQERLVVSSGLDWTLVRPTRLTNGAARGVWRTSEHDTVGAWARVSRADVAAQLVRALADATTIGAKLTLQY